MLCLSGCSADIESAITEPINGSASEIRSRCDDLVVAFFNALTKSNKISTLVSEKHFNPRSKSEVLHGRCRAQTKAPPVLFCLPYYLSNSRSCANFQRSLFR